MKILRRKQLRSRFAGDDDEDVGKEEWNRDRV